MRTQNPGFGPGLVKKVSPIQFRIDKCSFAYDFPSFYLVKRDISENLYDIFDEIQTHE